MQKAIDNTAAKRDFTKNIIITVIVLLLPVSVFYMLNILELRLEEPRRALVAIEMYLKGEYIIPKINGWPYYNKPPLFNWAIAFFFWLTGSYEEWVVRLPALLAYFFTGVVIYSVAKKFISKETAILTALFFLTFSDLYFFGTQISGEIDLFFTLLVTLQLSSIYFFYQKESYLLMFVVSYVFAALSFLTKGVPSLLFQGSGILIICIYNKKLLLLISWRHLFGIFLFFIIAGGYFFLYAQRGGNVGNYLAKLYYDSVEKSGLESSITDSIINFLLTPVYLLRFLSPWILFLGFLFKFRSSIFPKNSLFSFCVLIVSINIIPYLFTAGTKANYMYPLFPFIAVIVAYLYVMLKNYCLRLNKVYEVIFLLLMIIGAAGIVIASQIDSVHKGLPNALLYSIILALAVIITALFYYKLKQYRIYLFIFFWVILKLSANVFYISSYQFNSKQQHYREYVASALKKIDNKSISVTGPAVKEKIKLAFGPIKFDTVSLETPAFLPYKVSFYYSSLKNDILSYNTSVTKDSLYLQYTDKEKGFEGFETINMFKPEAEKNEFFYLIKAKDNK